MDDNDNSILSAIANLVLFYIKRISDLIQLAALEAKLAVQTLFMIAFLIFITSSLITVCWASFLTVIFFYLISIEFSYLAASAIILLVNIIALISVALIIYKIKDNLFFPATTKQLSQDQLSELDFKNEKIKTENQSS